MQLDDLLKDPDAIREAREEGRTPDALLPIGAADDYKAPVKPKEIDLGIVSGGFALCVVVGEGERDRRRGGEGEREREKERERENAAQQLLYRPFSGGISGSGVFFCVVLRPLDCCRACRC